MSEKINKCLDCEKSVDDDWWTITRLDKTEEIYCNDCIDAQGAFKSCKKCGGIFDLEQMTCWVNEDGEYDIGYVHNAICMNCDPYVGPELQNCECW